MKQQIEEIDKLILSDFPEHIGFKFCYQDVIDPDYAESLVNSLNNKED